MLPLSDQLGMTISFIVKNGLEALLLKGSSKAPAGNRWKPTADPAEITKHVDAGNGIGIVLGSSSGMMAFDGDNAVEVQRLEKRLGPLPLHTVGRPDRTGHTFFQWEAGLSAKSFGETGEVAGDLKGCGGKAYVVAPSGVPYESSDKTLWQRTWAVDARSLQVEPLPRAWAEWLGQQGQTRRDMGEQIALPSGPIQTFTLGQKAYVILHNALCKVWKNGVRHELSGATTAVLYLMGVDPKQIAELIHEVAINTRDGERAMRMSNVRSTVRRVHEGLPCRGSSTFAQNGLSDTLALIRQAIEADKFEQFGAFASVVYGSPMTSQ